MAMRAPSDDDDEDQRPTTAMVPLEKPDSARATVAMPPLFKDAEGAIPDREVNGYAIEREIGRGAMSIVYAAIHRETRQRVAVKVLGADKIGDREASERFLREARAATELGHPNIVEVFSAGTLTNGRHYLIMELLSGESLRARLKRGPLSVDEVARVIYSASAALAAAHARGMIHRDIKPDNLFLVDAEPPIVKLLDFGLIKLSAKTDSSVVTQTGAIVGTPHYMPPEQVRAKTLDHRVDIYALGVSGFELLVGRRPYEGDTALDAMIAQVNKPVPSIRQFVPEVPIELAEVIEAMMAKLPEQRPTLATVRRVLATVMASRTKATDIAAPAPPLLDVVIAKLDEESAPPPEPEVPPLPLRAPSDSIPPLLIKPAEVAAKAIVIEHRPTGESIPLAVDTKPRGRSSGAVRYPDAPQSSYLREIIALIVLAILIGVIVVLLRYR